MRFLIWLLIIYVAYRMLRGRKRGLVTEKKRNDAAAETYQDPHCGVYVPKDDAVVGVLDGKRLYFCSRDCLDQFQQKLQQSATANESGGNG